MCRQAKPKSNMANSLNLYPKTKGYFRETCKSQNINLISLTPKFNLGIIQIKIKSLSTTLILFDVILYVPSTTFQLHRDGSSWVEPVLSQDKCVLLKDHNAVMPVRLDSAASRSRVKHSPTEPLHSPNYFTSLVLSSTRIVRESDQTHCSAFSCCKKDKL